MGNSDQWKMVDTLLASGVIGQEDVSRQGPAVWTALHYAASMGNSMTVALLLANGAKRDVKTFEHSLEAEHVAKKSKSPYNSTSRTLSGSSKHALSHSNSSNRTMRNRKVRKVSRPLYGLESLLFL